MSRPFALVALLLIIAAMITAPAKGQTGLAVSSWPHSRFDRALSARARVNGPNLPQLNWAINIGHGRLGSPITASDGTIYIPGNEDNTLYAVAPNGQLLWSFTGKGQEGEQFVAPAVVGGNGVIYFGSTKNIFYAVNPNGSLRWTQTLEGEVRYSANMGDDGTIFVASQDRHLYAIRPNGQIKWRVYLYRSPGNGPAIASDGTVYVVAGELLKGFAPDDGSPRLEVDCINLGTLYGLVVDGFESIYVTGEAPQVQAIDNYGGTRWKYSFPESFGTPLAPALGKDHSLYFASGTTGQIFALNRSGKKRWSYSQSSAPYLTELALDDSNNVYIVNDADGLTSLSATGQLRWTMPEVHCQFSPGFGADGTIFIGSDKKLYAVGVRTPKMVVDANSLDGGQVCVGASATFPFDIFNSGSAPLQVNNLTVSHSAFRVEPASFVVAPGSRYTVRVRFTPTDFVNYSATLTIGSNAGSTTVALGGKGIGPQISLATDSLNFGTLAVGKVTSKLAFVFNAACELRIDSVRITGVNAAAFAVQTADVPKTLAKSDTAQLAVQFSPNAAGPKRAALAVYNTDKQHNPLVVPLSGTGVASLPEIDVAPLALEFGKTCQENQLYTVVANIGYITLRVDSLVFSNSAFSTNHARSFTVAPGASDTIWVRFKASAGTESNGTLVIFNNDTDEKTVAVKLHGSGDVADIAGLNEVDFGAVDVQTCAGLTNSAARTYVIRNEGHCELRIDSLITSKYFSIVSPGAPQRIAAGGSLNVSLKFTPAVAGNQTAALRIVSNDIDERASVVTLRGRGIAAADIAIAPDTLDFGSLPVGETQNAALNVRNLGELSLQVTSWQFSSSRFAAAAGQLTLSCAQDSAVTITFTPDSVGIFNGTLTIASDDPDEAAVKIFLRGRGAKSAQALIATDASEYKFAAVCAGERDSLRATVTNRGDAALRVDSVRVQSNPPVFSITKAGFRLEPQQSKTLTVFFKPARKAEYAATLQFFSNAANSRIFAAGLRGSGRAPEITGLEQLVFASTKVDSVRRETYNVNNAGDCALQVTSVRIEGVQANEFKIFDAGAAVIAPKGSSRVTLEFKPRAANARQALLVVMSSDPVRPRFEVALNGSGSGLPGRLAGPNAIDFGNACADEVITRDCILTNTGQSDLTITRLALGRGELFKISGSITLPKLLAAQESLTIPLAFAPKTSGAVSDTLLAQTDLPTNAAVRINLIGAGRDDIAGLNSSRHALAFSSQLDKPTTQLVTITNGGCARLEISQIELARKLRVFSIRPEMPLPVLLEKDASLDVTVVFKGDDFRVFADSLYVYSLDRQQQRERLGVSLVGKVTDGAPCLQVSLSQVDFGEVAVGQAKRVDLEVMNCSADSRIVVRTIQPASADFRALPDTLTIFPGNPQFFAVNFAPQRNGEIVDTLKFAYYTLTDPGRQQIQKVVLRGAGSGNRAFARPNAFTPNGDGKNDQAKIHFAGYDPDAVVLRVYDLRGLEVRLLRPARRGELEIGWDGRNDRGDMQMPGAYLWLLENNGKKVGSGQVVLIR